jgi:hypothetical protein
MGVNGFIQRGIEDDDRKFTERAIDPLSAEALPYYARWTRQDVIGVFYLQARIARINMLLLIAIAVPLWVIAFR